MLVIGYFTLNTPYEAEADRLRKNLDHLGIQHDFKPVESLGSWQKNTQYKARLVEDMLIKHAPQPMVYCDVDAEFCACPTLLYQLPLKGVDIAACKHGGHELLSGTVYFGNTETCMQIVSRWIALCEQYPETFPRGLLPHFPKGDLAWDQRMLDIAIRQETEQCRLQAKPAPVFEILPPEYCYIFDISKARYPEIRNPIIVHSAASRRFKRFIDSNGERPVHPNRHDAFHGKPYHERVTATPTTSK